MASKIKLWQWPNVLALDASAVALAWLWIFATEQSVRLPASAYGVLALSVWLTYLSDRLFDASRRPTTELLSMRHRFAKRHRRALWQVWTGALLVNFLLATISLNPAQLQKGFTLLLLCLAYTALNQCLSRRFFPKELLVALIFAGGTQVFLPSYTPWPCLLGFVLLCLVNCLMIAWQEERIDTMLQVRSLSSVLERRWFNPLLIAGVGLSWFGNCTLALLASLLLLGGIHLYRTRLDAERFRVLCDTALFIGPVVYFVLRKL